MMVANKQLIGPPRGCHRVGGDRCPGVSVPVRARVDHAKPGAAASVPEVQECELGPAEVVRAGEEGEVMRSASASNGSVGGRGCHAIR